jgi:hypothetical protein
MRQLQIFSGWSAIGEGVIYILAFVYFGAILAFPHGGDSAQMVAFLRENQLSLSVITFLMYILFGCLLAVLVVGIYQRLRDQSPALIQVATLFGVVWVGLVVASGMISNIGLAYVLSTEFGSPEKAMETWGIINVIVESLGGGNELIGGLWVLLLSVAAIKAKEFPLPLNYLGIVVGAAGISTVYPAEVLTEIFGVTQIVWFIWLGVVLLRVPNAPLHRLSSRKSRAPAH